MTAGFSLRGLLVALAIVALGLPAAVAGLFSVIAQIDRLNASIATVREAQLNAADVLRLQIEGETSVRGFAATRDPQFRETYRDSALEFPLRLADVNARLVFGGDDARAAAALLDAQRIHRRWQNEIALPLLADASTRTDDARSKIELNRFHADLDIVAAVLIADYHRLIRQRSAAVNKASLIGYSAIAVAGAQVLVYMFLAERLRGELLRERNVVTLLQRAFASETVRDPQLEVAATYVSATRGAKVGGDVYDVFPLDDGATLIVIADVSGKGVGAAVDSMFVKYSLRAFASEHADITTIVTKFNALYRRTQKVPEAFVVLFAGILDHRTAIFTYVNAGHEAAYVRRSAGRVDQLQPTGPIVGIADSAAFGAASTLIGGGDLLFLSTDGLTEARDPSGRFLSGDGVEAWLRETHGAPPQAVIDLLSRRLRQFTHARSNDDLAILAVQLNLK